MRVAGLGRALGTSVTLKTYAHREPIPRDGVTEATVEVAFDGDTMTVLMPDGVVVTATDPRIRTLAGPFACWEVFQGRDGATDTKVEYLDVWADSRPSGKVAGLPLSTLFTLPQRAVDRGLESLGAPVAVGVSTAMGTAAAASSAGWIDVEDPNGTIFEIEIPKGGPTGRVKLWVSAYVDMTDSTTYVWSFLDNVGTRWATTAISQDTQVKGSVYTEFVGQIPAGRTLTWQHRSYTKDGGRVRLLGTAGHNVTLSANPC